MYNTEFKIALRCSCNYSCEYCVAHNEKQATVLLPLDKIERIFNNGDFFSVTSFECGAGEPALHPQIKDLIKILLTKGPVSIPSNNSINPEKWLPPNSKGVLVRAALHPQGEKDLDGFLSRLLKIRETGAEVRVDFVARPDRLGVLESYTEFFKKENIPLVINRFLGTFNGKKYPDEYTEEERKIVGMVANTSWDSRLCLDMKSRNFFGIPCLAGYSTIYIDTQGNFKRCQYDNTPLDEIYTTSKPCRVNYCGCGLFLEKLNTQEVSFWNYWRKMYGAPLLPSPASKSNDQLYKENKEIYDQLTKDQTE